MIKLKFLTSILHRGLRYCFFHFRSFTFHNLFWLLYPFSILTFISLFYLDFYFPFLFGLLLPFYYPFLFGLWFSLFSLDAYSIAVTFWVSSKFFPPNEIIFEHRGLPMQCSRELLLLKRSEVETRNRLVFIHNIEKQISLAQIKF